MKMEQAFDEWIRKYEQDPEKFTNSMTDVKVYNNRKRGKVSDYGVWCTKTLNGLMLYGKKYWKTIGL